MKGKLIPLIFFVLGIMIFSGLFWPGSGGNWLEFTIEPHTTGRQVAEMFQQKGLVRSQYPFLVWMRVRNAGSKIHVGKYRFSRGRAAYWLVDDLLNGRTEKIHVTIPEGYATWQIGERLEAFAVTNRLAFMKAVQEKKLEGFLFPATYEFEYGLKPEAVAQIMRDEFDRRWTPELEARAKEWGWTKENAVTFASILEREVRVREELPLVSAVYHNRLKKNMKLEADPTVQYALGFWKERLSYDNYRQTKSPYNTYLNMGLPPGPICSPGMDALKAALWPAQSDALFFLATGDGHHTFSTDYREHTNKVNARNRNKQKNMLERKR